MYSYDVRIDWKSGRMGQVSSPELYSGFEVVTPPEFKDGIEGKWSPEHLFTAAVSSCLMTTFLAIAENSKLQFSGFSCTAKGVLEKTEGKFSMTKVYLYPVIQGVSPEQTEKAKRVLDMSEKNCLISNSVNSEIIMEATIEGI